MCNFSHVWCGCYGAYRPLRTKLECGLELVVLGILVGLQCSCAWVSMGTVLCGRYHPAYGGFASVCVQLRPRSGLTKPCAPLRVCDWTEVEHIKWLDDYPWSTQILFHKIGRAMIQAIFAQKTSATGQIGPRLLEALHWWCRVLQLNISETWPCHRVAGSLLMPHRPLCTARVLYSLTAVVTTRQWRRHPSS